VVAVEESAKRGKKKQKAVTLCLHERTSRPFGAGGL